MQPVERTEPAYPGCPDAVAYHEQLYLAFVWGLMRRTATPPDKALDFMKAAADETLAVVQGNKLAIARPQMDHPDFARYVAAKLGAV